MNNYVYKITDKTNNKMYIGVRTSKTFDLGIKYFSSSKNKDFIKRQKENPNNFIYEELANFKTRQEAMEMEVSLHEWFDIAKNEDFYNRSRQKTIGFDRSGVKETKEYKKQKSKQMIEMYKDNPEIKEKIKQTCKIIFSDPKEKQRRTEENKRRWKDKEYRNKQIRIRKENGQKEDFKNKISEYAKERWKDKEYREKMKKSMNKVQSTSEYKEKMKKRNIKMWKDEEFRDKRLNTFNENKKKHKSSKNIKIKNKITKEEKVFYSLVDCAKYLEISRGTLSKYLKDGFPKEEIKNQHFKKHILDYEGEYI